MLKTCPTVVHRRLGGPCLVKCECGWYHTTHGSHDIWYHMIAGWAHASESCCRISRLEPCHGIGGGFALKTLPITSLQFEVSVLFIYEPAYRLPYDYSLAIVRELHLVTVNCLSCSCVGSVVYDAENPLAYRERFGTGLVYNILAVQADVGARVAEYWKFTYVPQKCLISKRELIKRAHDKQGNMTGREGFKGRP